MQISLTFDPAKDLQAAVQAAVAAAYGTSGNAQPQAAAAQATAQPTVAADASHPSQATSPAPVADAPNAAPIPGTAPTPPAQSAAATNAPAGVELDKDGVPWDARIHSSSKKTNVDGRWAKRKGGDADEHARVTKELQSLMAAAPATSLPAGGVLGNPTNHPHQVAVPVPGQPDHFVVQPMPGAQVTASPAPQQPAPVATAPVGVTEQPLAVAPAPTQPALAPQGGAIAPMPTLAPMPTPQPIAPHDYVTLAQWVAQNLEEAGGKLKPEHVEWFCRQCQIVDGAGVGQFALVANRPDAVAWLYQSFVAQINAAG